MEGGERINFIMALMLFVSDKRNVITHVYFTVMHQFIYNIEYQSSGDFSASNGRPQAFVRRPATKLQLPINIPL